MAKRASKKKVGTSVRIVTRSFKGNNQCKLWFNNSDTHRNLSHNPSLADLSDLRQIDISEQFPLPLSETLRIAQTFKTKKYRELAMTRKRYQRQIENLPEKAVSSSTEDRENKRDSMSSFPHVTLVSSQGLGKRYGMEQIAKYIGNRALSAMKAGKEEGTTPIWHRNNLQQPLITHTSRRAVVGLEELASILKVIESSMIRKETKKRRPHRKKAMDTQTKSNQ